MLTRYKVAPLDINGCDAIEEDADGNYVELQELLPLLREARYFATLCWASHHVDAIRVRGKAFLDATADIEEEKGVEG